MKKRHQGFRTWCIHSDSGVGKTTVAATAPKPMVLDSNKGLMSIDGRPGFEHVRSFPIDRGEDLESAYANATGTGKRDWRKKYQTLVMDHMDDIQGIVLDELTERDAERDSRQGLDEISQRSYGIMGNRMRRYLRKIKKLPMHKILICATVPDKDTGKRMPSLVGALRNQLPYFCDVIVYMRTAKDGKRIMYLDDSEKWLAKCRAWWLPRRKYVVPHDDTEFLTKLFRRIAAGPGANNRGAEE